MSWFPIIALPNIDVRCTVESQFAAIVGQGDERVVQLCKEHPELGSFLRAFRDGFRRKHPASIVIVRDDAPETYRNGRAIAGFRDALALATIPYARAAVINHGRTMNDPLFANSFDFYPWMLDRHYRWVTAMTPALSGLDCRGYIAFAHSGSLRSGRCRVQHAVTNASAARLARCRRLLCLSQ